jgi:D-psicose/D-tagatose/L-ribulose 3-epimerase
MRLGINTFLFACPFHDRHTRFFPKFRKWGYDSVELAVAAPSDMDPAHIREQLDKNGLVAGTVCGAFGPGRDLRGKPAEQRATIAYVKALIGQMQVLGSSVLAGPIYSTVGRADAETPAARRQQWKLVRRHLRDLAAYAGDRGVTLCLEPLNRFETDFINTCDQALDMVADVGHPALKIHLDTFHMNIEEKDLGQAIRRCGQHLGHFHASGSDRGTPGNDHTDWAGIAAALKAVKYRGDVVVESFTSDVEIIARAAAIWRRIEPTQDEIAAKGAKFLRRALKL